MKGFKLLLPEHQMRKEDVMRTPEAVAAMQRLYGLGWGLRRITGELGCSRNTVKHDVQQSGWVPYQAPQRPRKLAHLDTWLATQFRQHRGNADVVRQELQKAHGLTVSLRTVERAVQPWRQELAAEARATVRFETAPGRQLQIDFGTTTVLIEVERVTIHRFVATLGFSRRAFVRVFDHERQSAWFDGLEGAFHYFGGLPEEVLLDNALPLVETHDPTSSRTGEHPSTATTSSTIGAPGVTGIGRSGAGIERLVTPLETKATLDPIAGRFVARGREKTATVSGENQLGHPGLLAEQSRFLPDAGPSRRFQGAASSPAIRWI